VPDTHGLVSTAPPIYFEGRCRSVKAEELNELNEGGLIRVCDDVESASLLPVFRPPEPG